MSRVLLSVVIFNIIFGDHAWPSPRAPEVTFCHSVKSRVLYCGEFCGLSALNSTVPIGDIDKTNSCMGLTRRIDQYYPGFCCAPITIFRCYLDVRVKGNVLRVFEHDAQRRPPNFGGSERQLSW